MRSIMKTVKPMQAMKLLNREKEFEVCKTAPKCWKDYLSGDIKQKPEPMTAYVYCANDEADTLDRSIDESCRFIVVHGKNHLIFKLNKQYHGYNGKIVAKFTLDDVSLVWRCPLSGVFYIEENGIRTNVLHLCGFSYNELYSSFFANEFSKSYQYAWHISNLVIFDRPKELSEFRSINVYVENLRSYNALPKLDRAPSSWCYVDELE